MVWLAAIFDVRRGASITSFCFVLLTCFLLLAPKFCDKGFVIVAVEALSAMKESERMKKERRERGDEDDPDFDIFSWGFGLGSPYWPWY